MIGCREFFYPSADGRTNIHAVAWQGEQPPRAVLQISHGICEYVERYGHFARWLAERGFLVVGNDHLGHGKSWQEPEREGLFGEADGWNTVVDDVEALRAETVHGDSRFDFSFTLEGKPCFLEVKGCTLENDGVCAFPDAPTQRGRRHLQGLARAAGEGYGAYVLFVIQMEKNPPLTSRRKHGTVTFDIEKAVKRNSIPENSAPERGRSVQVPVEKGRRRL